MKKKNILEIIKILDQHKAENIISYHCPKLDYAEFVILVNGLSFSHLKSLAQKVYLELKKKKMSPLNPFKDKGENSWLILDYDVLVIHFFLPETRTYYRLEDLLIKAKVIFKK